MSIDAICWAWHQQTAYPLDKLVLLALANWATEEHEVSVQIDSLCQSVCAAPADVFTAIERMQAQGVLQQTSSGMYRLTGCVGREDAQ